MGGYDTKQPPKLWIQNIVPAKLKPTNQPIRHQVVVVDKRQDKRKKCIEFTSFLPKNSNQNPEEASENDFDNKNKDNYSKEGFTAATKKRKKPKVDIKFPKVPTLLCIGDLIILEFFSACCLLLWKVVIRKSNHDGGDFWIFFETQKCYQKCCHRVALELAFPGSFGLWQPLTLPLRKAISSGGDKARKASGNARRSSTCLALLK